MEDVSRIAIALHWSIEVWQAEDDQQWYSRLLNEASDIVEEYGPYTGPTMAVGAPLLELVNGQHGYEAEVQAHWGDWAGW